jgi:predicted MPP superfamily phosphohydrolase
VVHSRYPVGEDRLIRLARASTGGDDRGTFILTFNGTSPATGQLDTGVFPRQGRWYLLKLRTEVAADRVVVRGKAWPAAEPEPEEWQAWAEDRSPLRVEAGTVGLWAWGAGTVGYRNLRVVDEEGAVLLERSLVGGQPPGFRSGARATRLELARARSPRVPAGTPEIVLVHSPDAVREAAASGIELVLAGHTHGGQVRLPFFGALTTRTRIGREYDRGLFRFPGPGRQGGTWLYVNPGLGTSFLPIRFFDPPAYAVIDLGPREEPPG